MAAPQEAREGENVEVRLRHMDQLGVDIQVLWPTLFLERVADRPEAEIAVCRSYNRWLADIWQQAKGRLRWVCVCCRYRPCPTRSISCASRTPTVPSPSSCVASRTSICS